MAGKCNEGQLTSEERAEYEAYAQAQAVVGPWAGWRNDAKPQREGGQQFSLWTWPTPAG